MFLLPILFCHFPLPWEAMFFKKEKEKGCTTCGNVIIKYKRNLWNIRKWLSKDSAWQWRNCQCIMHRVTTPKHQGILTIVAPFTVGVLISRSPCSSEAVTQHKVPQKPKKSLFMWDSPVFFGTLFQWSFKIAVTRRRYDDTLPKNTIWCRLWPSYIGEKGRTLAKTYGIKVRCYWEHPWRTHW